jgi:Zn-dependent protease
MPESPLVRIVAALPAFLLAIVLHEVAHGYVAYRLGDDTAKRAGRLILSPLAHLDPAGTLIFVISAWYGVGFGWAKPVPVSVERLRNPRRDDILVTLAGPAANLAQALAWVAILRLVVTLGTGPLGAAMALVAWYGVAVNVLLMLFNLLPIPPLDGSRVALRLLGFNDPHLADRLSGLGFILLFLLVVSPAFGWFSHALFQPLLGIFLRGAL